MSTKEPFTDKRVRQAIAKALDNAAIKTLVFPEGGDIGENHHVAPIHPEYFALPPLARDVEGAKALLAEAGKENLEVTIDIGNTDGPWHQATAEAMRDQLAEAGMTLNVNVMPASKYWEIWTSTPFGGTAWTHRPLGTMVLSLAYRTGVAWNETGYSNPEFEKALDEAEATLDVEARRAVMEKVEKILQDDVPSLYPIWRPVYTFASSKVHNYPPHPTLYHQFNKVWIECLIETSAMNPPPLRGRAGRGQGHCSSPHPFPSASPSPQGDGEGGVAMLKLILQRLAQMVLIMAVVSLVLFAVFDSAKFKKQLAVNELGGFAVEALTDADYEHWLENKGLNVPFYERYAEMARRHR